MQKVPVMVTKLDLIGIHLLFLFQNMCAESSITVEYVYFDEIVFDTERIIKDRKS